MTITKLLAPNGDLLEIVQSYVEGAIQAFGPIHTWPAGSPGSPSFSLNGQEVGREEVDVWRAEHFPIKAGPYTVEVKDNPDFPTEG